MLKYIVEMYYYPDTSIFAIIKEPRANNCFIIFTWVAVSRNMEINIKHSVRQVLKDVFQSSAQWLTVYLFIIKLNIYRSENGGRVFFYLYLRYFILMGF